jgi:hypothetical protein
MLSRRKIETFASYQRLIDLPLLTQMKNNIIASALVAVLGLALTTLPSLAQTDTNSAPAAPSTPAATPSATTTTTTPTTPTTPPPTKPSKSSKTAKAGKKTPYSGKITALSATSITVQGKEAMTMAISATTKFRVDKKKSDPSTFAVGDSITGSYTKDATGAMTAASIDKKSAAK